MFFRFIISFCLNFLDLTIQHYKKRLFNRFNMDPENKYTDEALWNALELVKLKSFVEDLPQKLRKFCALLCF